MTEGVRSEMCRTCVFLSSKFAWGSLEYVLDVASNIALATEYLWFNDLHNGLPTLFFVVLPMLATFLVNYMETNLRVTQPSAGCKQYFGYFSPISKWHLLRSHRETHVAREEARLAARRRYQEAQYNAAILEDVGACFANAPQFVLQISLVLRDIALFDGNLVGALTLHNILRFASIFMSAFCCLTALTSKLEQKFYAEERTHYQNEKRLAFLCIFTRVSFLFIYSTMAMMHAGCVAALAMVHWFTMIVVLGCWTGRCSTKPGLVVLESLLHVPQYVAWSERDHHLAKNALLTTTFTEAVVFLTGLVFLLSRSPDVLPPTRLVYIAGAGAYFIIVLFCTVVVLVSKWCTRSSSAAPRITVTRAS